MEHGREFGMTLLLSFESLHLQLLQAHCSYEAGILEDPNTTPPADMWKLTVDPLKAPDKPEHFTVVFEKGLPVKLVTEGKTITDPVELFLTSNAIARYTRESWLNLPARRTR
jgi:hypothetical protein